MRLSSILAWVGVTTILVGLAYPLLMLIGFGIFIVSAIMKNYQVDQTWKKLDKSLDDK